MENVENLQLPSTCSSSSSSAAAVATLLLHLPVIITFKREQQLLLGEYSNRVSISEIGMQIMDSAGGFTTN